MISIIWTLPASIFCATYNYFCLVNNYFECDKKINEQLSHGNYVSSVEIKYKTTAEFVLKSL